MIDARKRQNRSVEAISASKKQKRDFKDKSTGSLVKYKMKIEGIFRKIDLNEMKYTSQVLDLKQSECPFSRSNGTLTINGNKAYLFGGVSNHLHSEISCFDFNLQRWYEIEYINPFNLMKPRFGHTSALYK